MSPLAVVIAGLVLAVSTIVSGLLSGLETAIASMREYHVTALVRKNPHLAGVIRRISERPRRSLNQVILVLCVVNLLIAAICLLLLREGGWAIEGRPWLSTILLFGFVVLVGDLLPKLVALANPSRAFQLGWAVFGSLEKVTLRPADWMTNLAERFGRKVLRKGSTERMAAFSDQEIETLIEMRKDEGALLASESGMIQDIVRLGNKTAKDCMTPRVDAFLLPEDSTADEIRDAATIQKRWKAPIYRSTPDVIVGVLDIRKWLREGGEFHELIEPPQFVPETMLALDAFRDHLSEPRSLVVVTDEYGGVDGILTHADIIEAILSDEAPLAGKSQEIREFPDGVLQVAGDARLEEIADHLGNGVQLQRDGLNTIGGLIFTVLGRVPLPGTQIELVSGVRAIVRRNRGNRIVEVLIRKEAE